MKRLLGAALFALLLATPTMAGQLAAGDMETSFAFSWSDTDFGDVDGFDLGSEKNIALDGTLGWLLTDNHEIGAIVSYFKSEFEDGDGDQTDFDGRTLGAFYHFNFSSGGNATPYLGASIATTGGDAGEDYDLAYGIEGGVKLYPWENAGFLFNASWTRLTGDEVNGFDIPDADTLAVGAGVLVKWGR